MPSPGAGFKSCIPTLIEKIQSGAKTLRSSKKWTTYRYNNSDKVNSRQLMLAGVFECWRKITIKCKVYLTFRKYMLFYKCKVSFTSLKKEVPMKNKLEALRKERGISQEELAQAVQVSRQTIGSLEKGRYNPSIILAFRIAVFFDKPIEEIFEYEGE